MNGKRKFWIGNTVVHKRSGKMYKVVDCKGWRDGVYAYVVERVIGGARVVANETNLNLIRR